MQVYQFLRLNSTAREPFALTTEKAQVSPFRQALVKHNFAIKEKSQVR